MAGPAAGDVEERGRRRSGAPLTAVAGVLTLVYVVAAALDLVLLGIDPVRYNAVHRSADGSGPRLVLAVIGFAVVFHAADSVGRAAIDLRPAWERHRRRADAAGRFVALAAGVPVAAAIVWPSVRAWWVR
jgi:succinate dehydrogenase/fumarate reductase cytochrome b subunit